MSASASGGTACACVRHMRRGCCLRLARPGGRLPCARLPATQRGGRMLCWCTAQRTQRARRQSSTAQRARAPCPPDHRTLHATAAAQRTRSRRIAVAGSSGPSSGALPGAVALAVCDSMATGFASFALINPAKETTRRDRRARQRPLRTAHLRRAPPPRLPCPPGAWRARMRAHGLARGSYTRAERGVHRGGCVFFWGGEDNLRVQRCARARPRPMSWSDAAPGRARMPPMYARQPRARLAGCAVQIAGRSRPSGECHPLRPARVPRRRRAQLSRVAVPKHRSVRRDSR